MTFKKNVAIPKLNAGYFKLITYETLDICDVPKFALVIRTIPKEFMNTPNKNSNIFMVNLLLFPDIRVFFFSFEFLLSEST